MCFARGGEQSDAATAGITKGTLEVAVLPTERWTVRAQSGDEAVIGEAGGALTVDFRINIARTFMSGHVVYWRGCVDLLLKEPVTLPAAGDYERVAYEAAGIAGENQHTRIMALPILRDRDGELFYYLPRKAEHLNAGGLGWSGWRTTSFYAGEAGAATQDIYYAGGKLVNTWPDGELTFLGLRIEVREGHGAEKTVPNGDTRSGNLKIAGLCIAPLRLAYTDPFLFADSIFKTKGDYLFSAQIRNEFQGVPVREFSRPVAFDPADPASCRQKLQFPLGPDDNYWIKYLVTSRDGAVVDGGDLRWQVQGNPDATLPAAVPEDQVPSVGCLRINHGRPAVYARGEPLRVKVRVFAKNTQTVALSWQLRPGRHSDVLAQGKEEISFDGQPFRDVALDLPAQPERDAYRLVLALKDGDRQIDAQTYLLGYRTDPATRHDRAGDLTDRRAIHQHAYFRTTFLHPDFDSKKGITEGEELKGFREYLANASQIGLAVTYMLDLRDFEVLPSVFDFTLLDRLLDAAADAGCKLNVRIAHADQKGNMIYNWPKYYRQINYDGSEASGHDYYGAYSVTDPRVADLWLHSYRALFGRYQQHTAFQGYYVMQPGGEWTVVDQPWAGVCTGYDPAAAASFRSYLRDTCKLNLADVNKRWATDYTDWEAIQPPLPAFRSGAQPDLRLSWIDFCRYKSALDTGYWFPLVVKDIRKYDPRNLITIYTTPGSCRSLYGLLDYAHNGGNHFEQAAGEYIRDWEQGGIGWITEPHHPHLWAAYGDPAARGWVLDWSVWVMLSQAAGGGANLHVYYYPKPDMALAKHFGGGSAYDRLALFRPILEELSTLKLEQTPPQVATLSDNLTLYCKHRTTFGSRLEDLRRWFELLKTDSVPYETFTADHAKDYRLLVPNILDEVMSAENLQALEQGVRSGAKAIICANTGKYVPENGSEPFALLRALGVAPPASAYQLTGTDVTAAPEASTGAPDTTSALLEPGHKLTFFTLERLGEDLKSDEVKKRFWQYPYRWIPQTNYFGFYPGVRAEGGRVLARFADGGAALSLHKVGQGEVLVFWGTPDMSGGKLNGFLARAAEWAGVRNPRSGSAIQHTLEGRSDFLNRRYALLYQETAGRYVQKLNSIPDGKYFLDDMVSGQRLGIYEGKELRESGLPVEFVRGYSPLKIIRLLPLAQSKTDWMEKYRTTE